MAREKKPVHKVVMTEGKRSIIQQLLQEYDIQSAEDIQEALKDLLGGTIEYSGIRVPPIRNGIPTKRRMIPTSFLHAIRRNVLSVRK